MVEWVTSTRTITMEQGQALAKELNCQFMETSAKAGFHVDTLFKELLMRLPSRPQHLLDDRQKCLKQGKDIRDRHSGKYGRAT